MSKEKNLIEKAMLAIKSSEFLEKIAESEFKRIEDLDKMPWSKENEKEINTVVKKIKNLIVKSELELKNLSNIEAEVTAFFKKKK